MKPKPEELWKRIVNDTVRVEHSASDEAVTSIVSALRWQPKMKPKPAWDEALWPLILRIALPGATALFIVAALLPAPAQSPPITSMDGLIASVVELP